jgi:hypothetical protein
LTANRLVAALATLAVLGVLAPARAGVDRPPQFVVMAFDNCTELERWQELIDFAAELNRDGDRIHFTFLSAAAISSPIPAGASMKARISGAVIPASVSADRPSRFAGASST